MAKSKNTENNSEFIIFKTEDENISVVVRNFRITTPHLAIEGKTQQSTIKL
jgi:hypothetical protein